MAMVRGELFRHTAPMVRVGTGLTKGLNTNPRGVA